MKHDISFIREYPLVMKICDFGLPDKKIIIELDGAYHFYLDDLKTSFVNFQFRNLFIILNGWRMLEINFVQWDTNRMSQNMEENLMKQLKVLEENPNYMLVKN